MRIVSTAFFVALSIIPIAGAMPAAAEPGIHPDCVTQKYDLAGKRRCTCALETGGRILPNGRGWKYTRASAYDACMTQKGWI